MALSTSELRDPAWPTFSDKQVEFLEKMYPARCIGQREQIEDHLRYAGKVELISQLRDNVHDGKPTLAFTEDEEEALDDEAKAIVEGRLAGIPEEQ